MFMRHERQTWRIPAQYKCPLFIIIYYRPRENYITLYVQP